MPSVYEHCVRVNAGDIDLFNHVNNQVYVAWMQDAAEAHSLAQGWPADAYRNLGAGWMVRRHEVDYLRPAKADDEILVRTWVAAIERASSRRRYLILRRSNGELLAEARTDWVFVTFATGRVTRIPPEIAKAFEALGEACPDPSTSLGSGRRRS